MFPWLLLVSSVLADLPPAATRPVDFDRDIQPIFRQACLQCHGEERQRSGFRLDNKAAALKGGDGYAPAILPGNSAESPLIEFVSGLDPLLKMPPQGDTLTTEQIGLLRAWIDQGAEWPDSASREIVDKIATPWSFQPLLQVEVPAVEDPETWIRNPIDAFIADRLAQNDLKVSPEADRRTLIRRLSLVLTGLPPTYEEINTFLADDRPEAYEELANRLLDSPQYGERWARHWLDVVGFGETHGFEVNTPRNNAWPYRDYVIRALNEDKPYAEFIKDQLAGDAVGEDAATGFLVAKAALLPGQTGKDPESIQLARQDELNDMVIGAASTFLGLTVHCARCHDHKFDPISQHDYYAMTAIFAGVRHGERPLRPANLDERLSEAEQWKPRLTEIEDQLLAFEPLANLEVSASIRPTVSPRRTVDRFLPVQAKRLRFTILETSNLEPCIDELEVFQAGPDARNIALADSGAKTKASSTYPNSSIHRLEHLNDGKYGNRQSWISNESGRGWVEIEFPQVETIDRVVWGRDREGQYQDRLPTSYRIEVADEAGAWTLVSSSEDRHPYLADQQPEPSDLPRWLNKADAKEFRRLQSEKESIKARIKELTEIPMVYAGRFETPEETFLLHRGDPMQRRDPVNPGAIQGLSPKLELPADLPEQERRLALANWIAEPDNPLTARVLVNRLWHYHFGEGLVNTPSDFGNNGERPSHQELLDWLAGEFLSQGGSIKALQRLIVTSAAFRQSSKPIAKALAVDADGRLLWRFPPRRLEAEVIRDAMLFAAGTLDLRMGGPGFSAFAPNNNYVRVYDPKPDHGPEDWRRMIYQTKVRMEQDSTFGAFDCPDAGQNQPNRPRSTTPLQALNLFNSKFVNQQAALFADRIQTEAGDDPVAQVRLGYQRTLGREPDDEETRLCLELIREHDLTTFCRVLLNTNEFLFLP